MNDLRELRENGVRLYDKTTANYIALDITDYYLTLSINDKSYYFNKDNGEYDGHSVFLINDPHNSEQKTDRSKNTNPSKEEDLIALRKNPIYHYDASTKNNIGVGIYEGHDLVIYINERKYYFDIDSGRYYKFREDSSAVIKVTDN